MCAHWRIRDVDWPEKYNVRSLIHIIIKNTCTCTTIGHCSPMEYMEFIWLCVHIGEYTGLAVSLQVILVECQCNRYMYAL